MKHAGPTLLVLLFGAQLARAQSDSPPAQSAPDKPSQPDAPAPSTLPGAGLSPTTPAIAGGTHITPKEAVELAPTTASDSNEWKFVFHGYLRAPLRISYGPPTPTEPPTLKSSPTFPHGFPLGAEPPAGYELHGRPRVPGSDYLVWDYTNTLTGPWAELSFSYGNSWAMATVAVNAYNQTSAGYRHLQSQHGIDQAFLTLTFPEALGEHGGLVWTVGSFQNRYGTAGKYDAGMYETYLFGRTKVMGETLTASIPSLDRAGLWALTLEHGVGGKIDVVPFTNNENYQIFRGKPIGTPNYPYLSDRDPEYLPYAGPVPQGSTFLHHAHAALAYRRTLTLGAHYLFTWTPDDHWHPINSRLVNQADRVPRASGPIQGSMEVAGGELRLSGGVWGEGYVGFSHIDARNINALADAIEVVHSYSGSKFKENFFGRSFNNHTGVYQGPQNETGKVDTLALQYSFSFAQLARYPEAFWGDGPDLIATVFGMFTIVDSQPPPQGPPTPPPPNPGDPAPPNPWDVSTRKLKFGADISYLPLPWFGAGIRYDQVHPDLDSAYSRMPGNPGGRDLDFKAVSPRITFKSQFVTHEAVTLQYQYYWLGNAAFASNPYEWLPRADQHAFSLAATIWW